MDQIGANALKRTTKYDSNMQADTVSMAIKKLPSKTHASFSMSTVRIEMQKVPNTSDQNKQRNYRYFTLIHARTMTVKTVWFCIIIYQQQ